MSSISMPALAGLKPLREPQQVRHFVMAETQRVEAAPACGASADDEFLPVVDAHLGPSAQTFAACSDKAAG